MISSIFNKWKDRIAQYIEVRLRLLKLGVIEFTSNVLSYFIFSMLALFFLFLILLFMGFGLAEAYSAWLGSRTGGYFLAAGTFVVMAGIVVLCRKQVLKSLSGLFIRSMTGKGGDEEAEGPRPAEGNIPVE